MTASSIDKVICENYILLDWFPAELQFFGTSYLAAATRKHDQAYVCDQELLATERPLNYDLYCLNVRQGAPYNISQQDALFLNFILLNNSTCFGQTYCPSSGVLILYSQQLVFVILVMLIVCQQTDNITSMTKTICCEYSMKTPDDGQ